jgi:Flp pilus assembly protein TadG
MRTHWRDRRRDERGVALVEFALVLPLLVLICLGTVDFGRAYARWNSVKNAAREGAAYAQLHPGRVSNTGATCANPNNIEWHVHNESDVVNTFAVAVTRADGTTVSGCNSGSVPASGSTIKVKATTTMSIITPFVSAVLGGDPTISASVAVRVQ